MILSLSPVHLDLAPRRDAVAAALEVRSSLRIPPRSFFLRYADQVLVTDRRSIGVLGGPSFEVTDYYPSALGDPVLLNGTQGVSLWQPPEVPRPIYRFPEAGAHVAASLGGDRLLVTRHGEGASAVDAADGRVLWETDAQFHFAAVTPHGILALTADTEGLECYDAESGQRRWAASWSGGDLIGTVDSVLWGSGQNELLRIDCMSGQVLAPVPVENAKSPRGVLDERGVFHCCHGLNYQTYDLRTGGQRLSYTEFRLTAAGPSLGAGASGTLVATDGRLIFSDQRAGVWVVHPDRPEEPELVWRAKGSVSGLAARDGEVLVAEASGSVTSLGDPTA